MITSMQQQQQPLPTTSKQNQAKLHSTATYYTESTVGKQWLQQTGACVILQRKTEKLYINFFLLTKYKQFCERTKLNVFNLCINHLCDLCKLQYYKATNKVYEKKITTVIFENKFILLDIEINATIVTTTDIITSRQCKLYPQFVEAICH